MRYDYTYDEAGQLFRVNDAIQNKTFAYASGLLMSQTDGTNTLSFVYSPGGTALGFKYNGAKYFYLRNVQGDIVSIYDSTGTVVVNYSYDSWGKLLSTTGSLKDTVGVINPLRYRGYYYDTETGFYLTGTRYYDPVIGRFINADGVIAGVGGDIRGYNLFAYCMNNPINMSDPSGQWPQWIKNAASAVVNTVIKAVSAVVNTVKSAVSSVTKPTSNVVKTNSKLPPKGDPGSNRTLPNPDGTPKQKRWYGPDGNPERDRDYNHPGNMPFPHDHDWPNGERNKDHLLPDPSYDFSLEPVLGVGLVVVCVVGIAIVAADDATGVGIADDFLFGPLGAGAGKGLIMIIG